MGSRGRCPPDKEKKRIDQSIKMFYHTVKELFTELQNIIASKIDSFEKYKK